MTQLDTLTPAEYRQRYLELKATAEARLRQRPARAAAAEAPAAIPADAVIRHESIPEGWYWTGRIERGTSLRLVTQSGAASVSALIWNADDTSERLNIADTIKLQWTAQLSRGHALFSDMGRVLASIVEDSGAGHDALAGCSTVATNAQRWGERVLRNGRDNFLIAAAKLGLARRDVMPCLTFFAPVRTTATGALHWLADAKRPGDMIELRAEMNLLIALSNTPHPLDPAPAYAPGPVGVTHWRSPPPAEDDLCRNFSEEAVRGFENTDPLFAA